MFRDQIDILEGVMLEGALESLNQARKMPGIGEYLEYSFEEASSPMELANSIQGLYKTIQQARTYHDVPTLKEYGFTHMADVQSFIKIAAAIAQNPAEYFEAYKGTMDSTLGGDAGPEVQPNSVDPEHEVEEDVEFPGGEFQAVEPEGCSAEQPGMEPQEDPDVFDILQNINRMN